MTVTTFSTRRREVLARLSECVNIACGISGKKGGRLSGMRLSESSIELHATSNTGLSWLLVIQVDNYLGEQSSIVEWFA